MDAKKSNTSIRTKDSAATKVTMKGDSIYDQWRPPTGVRYQLSETNVHLDAVLPRVKLKYTTVEYEPGQDLTVPPTVVSQKFAAQRGRGPVFVFQEEIDDEKTKNIQAHLINTLFKHFKERQKMSKKAFQSVHDELMHQVGPVWYHELSPKQMQSADDLKAAMIKDHQFETIINTQESLCGMGLVLWPNHTKIEYALKKYYLCPIEFLLTIYRLTRPQNPKKGKEYTLNDRIILSCVVHLSIRDIFRELHLRIPSPPRTDEPPPKPKVKKRKRRKNQDYTKIKWKKGMSPYLNPIIYKEQKHIEEVYKNRHKEWPKIMYFDYMDDMYKVYYVDDLDSVVKRKKKKNRKMSKWTKPPKIPVRLVETQIKKKLVYELKKPSPYISPCKFKKIVNPEEDEEGAGQDGAGQGSARKRKTGVNGEDIVINTNIDIANVCCCSPQFFNKETTFDLKIKITTSDEELRLMQKLCPYNSQNAIGDLKLVQQRKLKSSRGSTEDKPIKEIEYSCECCTCGKSINICPEISSVGPVKTLTSLREMVNSLNQIEDEGNEVIIDEDEEETEDTYRPADQLDENFCQCLSFSEDSASTSSDDTFKDCTCKKSSDDCTCCICEQMNKDFLLKIKRYNEVHNSSHRPCTCECKCKKKSKPPCCDKPETPPCKYCFCKTCGKKTQELEEEEEEEEEEEAPKEDKSAKKLTSFTDAKEVKEPDDVQEEEEEPKPCACQKLFTTFLTAHESCMSLFTHYKQKIQEDIEEYLQDIKNTKCLCGDTDSSSNEMDEELRKYEHQETFSDGGCKCDKPPCDCGCTGDGDPFEGCTCGGPKVPECTCNDPSSSSEDTGSGTSSSDQDSCCCTCGKGPCQCEIFLEKVRQMKACKKALEEQQAKEQAEMERRESQKESIDANKKKDEENDDIDEEENVGETTEDEEKIEDIDPRIIVLDKFPTKPKEQLDLLKTVLADLAEDGYPMAMLPQVHRLPHFQVWLNKRVGKYIPMNQRYKYIASSLDYWNHLRLCVPEVAFVKRPISTEKVHTCTWGAVNTYNKMISRVQTDFRRRVKQGYINQAQEMFPTMYHYQFWNKSFRNCYFSYLAADENHIFVFKPWETRERKNMSRRKPCR